MKEFYNKVILSFKFDAHSVPEISGCCHKIL
jgi:hypothetical protein